jgi:hypothetical protein
MLTLITSINERLYHDYGKRFIESWRCNAGSGVRLVVCLEGNTTNIDTLSSEKLIFCDLESNKSKQFRLKYSKFFQAAGLVPTRVSDAENLYKFSYNYRYDALRFSFKAFSYYRVISELSLTSQFVGWIDSDVVCLRQFSLDDLSDVLPRSGELGAYLGRTMFPRPLPYSECGFLAFQYTDFAAQSFIDDFVNMYDSGAVFLNPEWHDCIAFDVLRRRYEMSGHKFRNLSADFQSEEHPFVKSKLGVFFDHLKGPARKLVGSSRLFDSK